MGAAAVQLQVESGTTEGSYSFQCPVCEDVIEKRADRKVVMLLLSAGVEVHEVPVLGFDEEDEPVQQTFEDVPVGDPQPEGPPLSVDDLIDFHFLLQREDWLDDLMAAGR